MMQSRSDGCAIRNWLRLNTRKQCLENRRLLWFGNLETMEESFWLNKGWKFEAGGSLSRGAPTKIWSEVITRDLEELKVSKKLNDCDLNDLNTNDCTSFIKIRLAHACIHEGRYVKYDDDDIKIGFLEYYISIGIKKRRVSRVFCIFVHIFMDSFFRFGLYIAPQYLHSN